jgi:hypothetical protein
MGAARELTEPLIAFCVWEHEQPAVEIRINFGVFSGRQATPAEIDDLANELHDTVDSFTVVAEERHEFAGAVEAAIHQVVIEVDRESAGARGDELCDALVEIADAWATDCFAARRSDVSDL